MSVVFDLIIFLFLSSTGVFLLHVSLHAEHRRKRPVFLLAWIVLFSWLVIFYGSFVEPKLFVVREQSIALSEQASTSLRVAVIADFHLGPYKKTAWVQKVVDQVMQTSPDMILIPGDFIYSGPSDTQYLEPLGELSAPHGVIAVTGNHDYIRDAGEDVVATLKRLGITVLQNRSTAAVVDGNVLSIAGVDDFWNGANMHDALRGLRQEDSVILLSHNPDVVMFSASKRSDLVISGHTHGGQIRLPWIGPVPNLPTMLGRAYDQGLHEYNGEAVFITSGVGESGPRARLFNPPEINILTISF